MRENLYIFPRTRIIRDQIIHVSRKIDSGKGKITVRAGEEVKPEYVIGDGETVAGFSTVRLAAQLQVDPKEAPLYLTRKLGTRIYQGELLAQRTGRLGFGKKLVVSPADGILEYYDPESGDLKIKFAPKKFKLISGVYGVVDKVEPTLDCAVIRTMCDIVVGLFGSGKERSGILQILGPSEMLTSSRQIGPEHKGNILVGGGLIFLDALQKALSLQVGGIITGGVDAATYKGMTGRYLDISKQKQSDVGVSLMVTEGFGSVPIGLDIYQILKLHEGKFAVLDGNKARLILPSSDQNSIMYIRKCALPPQSLIMADFDKELTQLKLGMLVRVVSATYLGTQGRVVAVDDKMTTLPSGVSAYMVVIETKDKKIKVPFNNLEIITT